MHHRKRCEFLASPSTLLAKASSRCGRRWHHRRATPSSALAVTLTTTPGGPASGMSSNAAPTISAEEALQRLKAGNERFIAGTTQFPTAQKEILSDLAKGQHPYATILSCSDSRVPPELVFDAGFGELFIIRVAGNVMSPEIAGRVQYAGRHLHTPLFVVLGHTNCGAVAAAIETRLRGAREH